MERQQELSGTVDTIGIDAAKDMVDGVYIGSVAKKNRFYLAKALKIYATKNKTLEWCSRFDILNRSTDMLRRICREEKIKFIDYVPMSMRPKK